MLSRRCWILLCLIACLAGCERDWREAAVKDEEYAYRTLRDNHPAMVDPANGEFSATLERAHAKASALAERVQTPAGYMYALRRLTIPFNDLHVGAGFYERFERSRGWPGFALGYENDQFVVKIRENKEAPPLGAQLISCDGRSVDEMLDARIRPFIGNWALPGKRPGDAPYLLANTGNPFVDLPKQCRFSAPAGERDYALEWVALDDAQFLARFDAFEPAVDNQTAWRQLDDGSIWISVASFDLFDPSKKSSLTALAAELKQQSTALGQAPSLTIDVRGNLGGSSEGGQLIASAIWGEDYVDQVRPRATRVDWRASEQNVEALTNMLPMLKTALGDNDQTFRRINAVEQGMQQALSQGDDYYAEMQQAAADTNHQPLTKRTVFLLVDQACVSACLDFIDLLTQIPGVTLVGKQTSGDTRYLEVRAASLPSGLGQIAFPTAAHRGRLRADNQSYVPAHVWDGDISKTAELEGWLQDLASRLAESAHSQSTELPMMDGDKEADSGQDVSS